jgi:hypothetical protein
LDFTNINLEGVSFMIRIQVTVREKTIGKEGEKNKFRKS